MLSGATVLVTGATGSFGKAFIKKILADEKVKIEGGRIND